MKIADVFAVYGDYGNFGGGSLIGVFEDEDEAIAAAKGRGSFDCGGDGEVVERKAIQDGDKSYLIETNFPVPMNEVLIPDTRYVHCEFSILVEKIFNNKRFEFLKLFRDKTKLGLIDAKNFLDSIDSGEAVIPNGPFSKEESESWKKAAEGIAEIKFI